MSGKALKAGEVTEPGAYEWIDQKGVRHVGFLSVDRRGTISGSFVSSAGNTAALSLRYSDGSVSEGTFYGPLPTHHTTNAQT
jgi:hypothetical protein